MTNKADHSGVFLPTESQTWFVFGLRQALEKEKRICILVDFMRCFCTGPSPRSARASRPNTLSSFRKSTEIVSDENGGNNECRQKKEQRTANLNILTRHERQYDSEKMRKL